MMNVDTVSSSISPQDFYERFVSTRTPALIKGHITDQEWQANKWTLEYLTVVAGESQIQIERKTNGTFGNGIHETMTTHQFLSHLQNGDETYYLTTQELSYTTEDKPELVSEPIKSLLHDIPTRPHLLGNLIPQNVNLWMGLTRGESTSGLHHDYHDNLYILLHGSKRFRLFPPQEIYNLYTYGVPDIVYSSGRVNYRGQLPTTSDGSSLHASTALQASIKLERVATALDEDNNDDDENEYELDAAMEELLDAEIADDDDYDEDGDSDGDGDSDNDSENESEDLDQYTLDDVLLGTAGRPLKIKNEGTSDQVEVKRQRVGITSSSNEQNNSKFPLNFSRVREGELTEKQLQEQFPAYVESRNRSSIEVTVTAGNMLFIPAGEHYSSHRCIN